MKTFDTLDLSPAMLKTVSDLGYAQMTEIQEASIPHILAGRDVLAQAKTGSGKTAAFGIGLIERLEVARFRVQSLVICPTRELAAQVCDELRRLARSQHNLKIVALTGGLPMKVQEHSLSHQAHVAVGTPGRLLKLLQRRSLVLDELKTLVLDEADRMLDMGFITDIQKIMRFAPKARQTLCFSATFPEGVKTLAAKVMREPVEVSVAVQHDDAVIEQLMYSVAEADKARATLEVLARHKPASTLVFCNTKDACRAACNALNAAGVQSLAFNGDMEQRDRTETLVRFSNGSCRVLVATDVAARGIDIDTLACVINYDLSFKAQAHVHRVGRTGRAGATGLAVSFVAPGQWRRLAEIDALMGTDFADTLEDYTFTGARTVLQPDMVTLSINGGRKNKISAGDLLGALTSDNGVQGADVGKIDRFPNLTFVAVKREVAQKALNVLRNAPIKGRTFRAMIHR